ncbi:hypothetical protein JAAARDRAFT_56039 [Jaapia argillacea MUCL 33604]|uniref:Uncharacterized protein n=1 Tax=Jaapia argillacea MUCL 33604 TaxID=933084 RepID=A0A067Q1L0_9AGAM|nr:hypothetical protein JAAARDRAFT_56039 [Jaapia argillacea MUCL 33604]
MPRSRRQSLSTHPLHPTITNITNRSTTVYGKESQRRFDPLPQSLHSALQWITSEKPSCSYFRVSKRDEKKRSSREIAIAAEWRRERRREQRIENFDGVLEDGEKHGLKFRSPSRRYPYPSRQLAMHSVPQASSTATKPIFSFTTRRQALSIE